MPVPGNAGLGAGSGVGAFASSAVAAVIALLIAFAIAQAFFTLRRPRALWRPALFVTLQEQPG
jgi:uncharacterized membrane protein YhiD involved in acid resistance